MQPTTKTTPIIVQQKPSHKASITGFILAVLSLLLTGIANFAIKAKYTPTGPTTGSVEAEAGHAIATGTTSVLGTLFGMGFLFGAICFAILALIFIMIRVPKVKVSGLVFSLIAGVLAIWSLVTAIGLFDLIKANPAV